MMGDLDSDFDHDLSDFLAFRTIFNDTNGAGAFAAIFGNVPEPSAFAIALIASAVWCGGRSNGRRRRVSRR
jgi:hypothetical protein